MWTRVLSDPTLGEWNYGRMWYGGMGIGPALHRISCVPQSRTVFRPTSCLHHHKHHHGNTLLFNASGQSYTVNNRIVVTNKTENKIHVEFVDIPVGGRVCRANFEKLTIQLRVVCIHRRVIGFKCVWQCGIHNTSISKSHTLVTCCFALTTEIHARIFL